MAKKAKKSNELDAGVSLDSNQKSFLKKVIPALVFIGGLCCFTPIIMVLVFGSSIAFAASLSDTLYGTYKWVFRGVALSLLAIALWWYFYKVEKVCSWDEAVKKKNRIFNLALISVTLLIVGYALWLYVIVEYIGILLGIWG